MTEPLRNHGDRGGATAVYVIQAPQWHHAFGVTGVLENLIKYLFTHDVLNYTLLVPIHLAQMDALAGTNDMQKDFHMLQVYTRSRLLLHSTIVLLITSCVLTGCHCSS